MQKEAVAENKSARVIPNLTFYDLWEMRDVVDHLMIIPKRHVTTLKELTPTERSDIMDLMADYEAQGYDIYARSPDSIRKSVPHQHTHLIKTTRKVPRGMFVLEKPYFVFRIK
jgi:ATP adenylyltransferase